MDVELPSEAAEAMLKSSEVQRKVRELAEPINLPIGHLQNAPDIAQHAPRLQRAEGNDLRDLIAPVFLLDVANDFVAPVLAEVDVEIRHRNPFGI